MTHAPLLPNAPMSAKTTGAPATVASLLYHASRLPTIAQILSLFIDQVSVRRLVLVIDHLPMRKIEKSCGGRDQIDGIVVMRDLSGSWVMASGRMRRGILIHHRGRIESRRVANELE